jgi:hypothetical protein
MSKHDPYDTDLSLAPAFDWLDDGSSRLMTWIYGHWRFAISAVAGIPVLVGIAIGLLAGWIIF